jgi:hypothetical protein
MLSYPSLSFLHDRATDEEVVGTSQDDRGPRVVVVKAIYSKIDIQDGLAK